MKKNLLSVAVAASVAGAATIAQADGLGPMFVSPENTGETLIFPYYNAENGNTTSFHIVNTTADAKALKVRFREYKASYEVLDFNVYMSPKDHFSFTVAKNPAGDGGALITRDNTCTLPALGGANPPFNGGTTADGAVYQPFVNFAYSKQADSSIERSLAGYVEVIEMGASDTSTEGKAWKAAVTHAKGVPSKCATLSTLWATGAWAATPQAGMTGKGGGLYGISYALNANDAAAFGIEPVVIDNFRSGPIHATPGSLNPNLGSGNTSSIRVFDDGTNAPTSLTASYTNSTNAVSSLMMTTKIMNDVMNNAAVGAQTDWVITFPTKYYYTNNLAGGGLNNAPPSAPFSEAFVPGTAATKENLACETVTITSYDREEATIVTENPGFSPAPPSAAASQICYEMNVLQNSAESSLNATLPVSAFAFPFTDGWMDLGFAGANSVNTGLDSSTTGADLKGLPAVGFMATKYENSTVVGGTLYSYGHVAEHKYNVTTSS